MGFVKCSNCGSDEVRFFGKFHEGTSKTHCGKCGMTSWARKREEKQPEIFYEVSRPRK